MQVQTLPDYAGGEGGKGGGLAKARLLCPLSPRSNHHPPLSWRLAKGRAVDRTQEEGKRGAKKEGKVRGEGRHEKRGSGGFRVPVGWSHT